MIGYSFKEVRHAVAYRCFDEVDRPQSGGLFAVIEESNLTG